MVLVRQKRVSELILSGNELGPKGISEVALLCADCPQLTVDLGWRKFNSRGAAAGASARSLPSVGSLESLHSYSSKRSDGSRDSSSVSGAQLPSAHILISPDQMSAQKYSGGDAFNANLQWALPPMQPDGSYTFAFRLHNLQHWIAVGWAPPDMHTTSQQHHKFGCYYTSTGFPLGPLGYDAAGEVDTSVERGTVKEIRTRYIPSAEKIVWETMTTPPRILNVNYNVPSTSVYLPTICFGHQGGTVTLLGGAYFNQEY